MSFKSQFTTIGSESFGDISSTRMSSKNMYMNNMEHDSLAMKWCIGLSSYRDAWQWHGHYDRFFWSSCIIYYKYD